MGNCLIWLVFAIYALGCTTSNPSPEPAPKPANELYLRSQREVSKGDYEKAYRDYREAVEADPGIANASHLSNILYTWAISQSRAEAIPLLTAQKDVMLTPGQFAPRERLLSVAVDQTANTIHVFGLGVAPEGISPAAQTRILAREAALTDAQAWVARLALWLERGVEASFDVSRAAIGVQPIEESWLMDTVYLVKVKAPLNKNLF